MNRQTRIVLSVALVAVALASFSATLVFGGNAPAQPAPEPMTQLLDLSPSQADAIKTNHPHFAKEAAALSANLRKEKAALAAMLDNPATPDDRILSQVDRVNAAHAALENRVAKHVLAIRKHLTPAQQKRLMGLCAQSVRGTDPGHKDSQRSKAVGGTRKQGN
jgi:Spy/CpxP family protein refolding chaperone